MKKFTAIIIVLFLVISLTACSSTSYRYADNWSIEVGQTIDDPVAVIEKYVKPDASKFDEMLKDTKKLVKESVPYPELLDWDKFDQLQTVKELRLEDTSDIPFEVSYIITHFMAIYDKNTGCCYILPQFYTVDVEQEHI